jgi:hypothetical protein
MRLPGCEICGRSLRLRAVVRQWREKTEPTYPFRMWNGSREERPVRWLCGGCERRAEEIRAAGSTT